MINNCDSHDLRTTMTKTNQTAQNLLNDDDIGDFLRQNPDFFSRNPDVLVQMQSPGRYSDAPEGVVDFQTVMVDKLRDEVQNLAACTQDVIETSRNNMTFLTRTHAAVLALLSAHDAAHMARILTDDLPLLLDVDYVAFAFEQDIKAEAALRLPGVRMLPFGYIDDHVGVGGDVALVQDLIDDGTLFGDNCTEVRSAAIARLRASTHTAPGLMILGSVTPGLFHPGQGTDLLNFLARATEKLFSKWLSPTQ
ncbi:MAG: hypothetical protein COB46_11555 [Rhodospirillaceae bacterium]|nr:MAG: hypothetical protein COB46_11555 [Rhodospirillaceae bacterium]